MSFLKVAIEEHSESSVDEIEYCYFLKIDLAKFQDLLSTLNKCKKVTFSESKLPGTDQYKGRIRQYPDDHEITYELTTKQHVQGRDFEKKESNVKLDVHNYNMLKAISTTTCVRTRFFVPITGEEGGYKRENGEDLQWEVDVYIDGTFLSNNKGINPCEWIKLELEVDNAALDDVIKYIPIDYETLIKSDTKDESEKALIKDLYDRRYNVEGKIDLAQVSALKIT